MAEIAQAKKALRAEAAAKRRAAARDGADRARAANARLLEVLTPAPSVFSAYRAIGDEIDPAEAYAALIARGARGCLPVVAGKGLPLIFRFWAPGEPLETGAFRVEIPRDGAPATPQTLIAPLLAFDRRGYRLGYGGGFYDRTLAALRARGRTRAIGFAFAAQEVDAVPTEPTDAPLDLIVTEEAVVAPSDLPAESVG